MSDSVECLLHTNVRIPHRHVWPMLQILISQSILTFVLHASFAYSFSSVQGVLILKILSRHMSD
jgi:hypothetical protein